MTTVPAHSSAGVFVARQPIYDRSMRVAAYKLLLKHTIGGSREEEAATSGTVAELGLNLVMGHPAHIRVSRRFVLEGHARALPADRVVLELLERNEIDDEYVERARALAAAGYQLALDDFTWDERIVPLLESATYVKLDLRALGVPGVNEHVRRLAPHGVRIVAEKVETEWERTACAALGLELFQGYFFERPRLVRGRPAPKVALDRMRAAAGVAAGGRFEDVERVVRNDPGLSVRLLRYVNSAAVGLRHPVGSLRQAMMLVGADRMRQWILLVMIGDLGRMRPALLASALLRARLCEQLARVKGIRGAESAFTVGLLSVCDALLEVPLDAVIPSLPLTEDVRDAIVSRHGQLGALLSRAVVLQHAAAEPEPREARVLAEAHGWAEAQLAELSAA